MYLFVMNPKYIRPILLKMIKNIKKKKISEKILTNTSDVLL